MAPIKTEADETRVVECLPVYSDWLNGIASRYRRSQIKAAISVNAEMLKFYWSLGADIIRMEKDQPWGSKFMQRLSTDLKVSMPDASCFSRVNLYYMVRFFKLYVPPKIVQQVAEQLRSPFESKQQEGEQIRQQVADQLGTEPQGIAQIIQQDAEQLLLTKFVNTRLNPLLCRLGSPTMSLSVSSRQTSSRSCPQWKKWRVNLRVEWKSPSITWAAC